MILQPKLLSSFWQTFTPGKGLELTDLVQLVPSPYSQLTLFDPRLPHGVRPVSGTKDPQQVRRTARGYFATLGPYSTVPCGHEQKLSLCQPV